METKQQQQKIPTTKKLDPDLDTFLHSVICLPIKNINKQLINTLDDTDDVKFSLYNILNFDLIKNSFKSCISPCKNGTIFSITFKFIARLNMQLIFDFFYASRKKRQLFNHLDLMCGQTLCKTLNIEYYIDFFFLFFFFTIFFFLFFYSFLKFFDITS
jgi:hypothetical protein